MIASRLAQAKPCSTGTTKADPQSVAADRIAAVVMRGAGLLGVADRTGKRGMPGRRRAARRDVFGGVLATRACRSIA